MKRFMNWLSCALAVFYIPTLLGGTTDGSWVRADVYATTFQKSHDLVVLPAWIWSRANVLSIIPSLEGKSELKYVTPQHRVVKIEVDLPDDLRKAVMCGVLPRSLSHYGLSRTTHTSHIINKNGGYVYSVIEGKKDDVRNIKLHGINQEDMEPDICTLMPRNGKIAVLFSNIPHDYIGTFDAASGRLCSDLVPLDEGAFGRSLLWISDTTLALTNTGARGSSWYIVSLKTGKTLARGVEKDIELRFIVLPEGLFAATYDGDLKCVYRTR